MQPFMPFSTVRVCINSGDLSEQVHVKCVCTYVGLPSLQVIQGHALCSQWHIGMCSMLTVTYLLVHADI